MAAHRSGCGDRSRLFLGRSARAVAGPPGRAEPDRRDDRDPAHGQPLTAAPEPPARRRLLICLPEVPGRVHHRWPVYGHARLLHRIRKEFHPLAPAIVATAPNTVHSAWRSLRRTTLGGDRLAQRTPDEPTAPGDARNARCSPPAAAAYTAASVAEPPLACRPPRTYAAHPAVGTDVRLRADGPTATRWRASPQMLWNRFRPILARKFWASMLS
jgi:hypothetical protein